MAIGFQSFTDGTILQVDSEKKCYVLKGAYSGTSDGNRSFFLRIEAGIQPLVFFHESDGAVSAIYPSGSGNQISYQFYTNTPNQTVRYYHYDVISSAVTPGAGIQLFNSAGEITFDSLQRPLGLYGAVSGVKPITSSSLAINTAREYAVNISTVPLYSENAGGGLGNYFCPKPGRSGSNLIFTQYNYLDGTSFGYIPYDMAPVTALVVDITGIPTPPYVPPPSPTGYWQIVEGTNGGVAYGYASYGSPTYGSIHGTTTFGGATIKLISQSRADVKGTPFVSFTLGMSGNRAISFWTSLFISGYGTLTSASANLHSYDGSSDTTTWQWPLDIRLIDGFGLTEGIFT